MVSVQHGGAAYDVFERSCWDRRRQRLDVTYEYLPKAGGEVLQGCVAHRYLLTGELGGLLERAGLRLLSMSGSWNGGPVEPDGEFFVAVAALDESSR